MGIGSIEIPSQIFADRSLSIFESIVEFLTNTHQLSLRDIATLTGRDSRTIWTVLDRVKKKREGIHKIPATFSDYTIPISVLSINNSGILGPIVRYLIDRENLTYSQASRIISRSPKTVWTAYNRK